MTTRAFPQLPDIKALLTGPAQALANIERGFPIGPPPVSIGQTLSQIATSLPVPGALGAPAVPDLLPPAIRSTLQAALTPQAPRPSGNGRIQPAVAYARTGIS
jgi:hypothetical protein